MTQAEQAALILASQSPRRATLLQQIELPFEVVPAQADEPPPEVGEEAIAYTRRTAIHKANDVKAQLGDRPAWIVSADTIVVIDGTILGKPPERDPSTVRRVANRVGDEVHERRAEIRRATADGNG